MAELLCQPRGGRSQVAGRTGGTRLCMAQDYGYMIETRRVDKVECLDPLSLSLPRSQRVAGGDHVIEHARGPDR